MRNISRKAWGITLAGLAGAIASTLPTGGTQTAHANGNGRHVVKAGPIAQALPSEHQSLLRIKESDSLPLTRQVKIGLGKSMLVELPRDLRDVMVSDPGVVDVVVQTSNRVFLLAKKIGEANAFFFDVHSQQFVTLELFVERDATALQALLNRLVPGSNIKVEMLNETVLLTGSVKSPADANRAHQIAAQFVSVELQSSASTGAGAAGTTTLKSSVKEPNQKVINMLAVEGEEQVMLKVTVAEVQRSLLKQFGVNLGAVINSGNFSTSVLTENALPLTAAAGLGKLPVPGISTAGNPTDPSLSCTVGALCTYNTGPAGNTFGNSGVSGGWQSGGAAITHAMRALERDGLIRTLAEPNLTAVSGEAAKFLAGGEFPVPMVDSQGQVSVTFKEFGVGVAFTPIVLSEGRISLKIETEVSELTNTGAVSLSGISIPALRKRQAKSTVELPSGGSLAIAGLISDDTRQNIDGFPGLKDVPVLGTLFRSRDFIRQEAELVVIVTPYVVRANARQQLATPVEGLAPASDKKANFLGHLNRVYGRGNAVPRGDLKGDFGFIVE